MGVRGWPSRGSVLLPHIASQENRVLMTNEQASCTSLILSSRGHGEHLLHPSLYCRIRVS